MTVRHPILLIFTSQSITKHLSPLHPEKSPQIKNLHCQSSSRSPAVNDNTLELTQLPGVTHLEQRVELSLQDGPGVAVLGGDLEGEGHALPGEAVIKRHQGPVNSRLDQVICKIL